MKIAKAPPESRLAPLPKEQAPHYKKPTPKFPVRPAPGSPLAFTRLTSSPAARIADLERQLAREQNKTRILTDEQKENIKLIGEYEHHLGEIVKDVRDFSFNTKTHETSVARHYNKLLQDEKDAHLAARLEKDDWHAKFMRTVEMLRESYRLRCEEEETPVRIIAGLQNEVRALRSCLGMEAEKPEEEYGWEILKDVPNGSGEP